MELTYLSKKTYSILHHNALSDEIFDDMTVNIWGSIVHIEKSSHETSLDLDSCFDLVRLPKAC